METFTPISAAIGGGMIGLAAVLLAFLTGRVAGISGILGNALVARAGDLGWRLAFLAGLLAGPMMVAMVAGRLPVVALQASVPVLIVAGLLVGFGTRLGNGCTSGHGICGIGLGSPRSLLATVVFFASAVITVFVMRHVIS